MPDRGRGVAASAAGRRRPDDDRPIGRGPARNPPPGGPRPGMLAPCPTHRHRRRPRPRPPPPPPRRPAVRHRPGIPPPPPHTPTRAVRGARWRRLVDRRRTPPACARRRSCCSGSRRHRWCCSPSPSSTASRSGTTSSRRRLSSLSRPRRGRRLRRRDRAADRSSLALATTIVVSIWSLRVAPARPARRRGRHQPRVWRAAAGTSRSPTRSSRSSSCAASPSTSAGRRGVLNTWQGLAIATLVLCAGLPGLEPATTTLDVDDDVSRTAHAAGRASPCCSR